MNKITRFLETSIGLWVVVLFFVGLWVVCWIVMCSGLIVKPPDGAGTFGDMFGVVNALFGGLTVAGVFYSIILTRKELREARQEIDSKEQSEKIQQFENRFFQLLQFHNGIINSLDLRSRKEANRVTARGRDCFKSYFKKGFLFDALAWFMQRSRDGDKVDNYRRDPVLILQEPSFAINDILQIYNEFYPNRESDLGHYFGNLLQLLKYVDRCELGINKKEYTDVLRAQLSTYELVFLFYHGLGYWGQVDFKPLIEKYGLLHKLKGELLFEKIKNYAYEPTAFIN